MDVETIDGSLHSGAPDGPIETRWQRHRFEMKLVNPANKRKYRVIVVGTGLAGGSAAGFLPLPLSPRARGTASCAGTSSRGDSTAVSGGG